MKYIKLLALSLCMTLGFISCNKQEMGDANAVATEYSSMEFAAVNAEPQTLPVYSDGTWTIENDSEWVNITPMSGYGSMDVTVTVTDNVDGEDVDLPRKTRIYFKSGSSAADQNCSVIINQKGDKYKGLTPVSVSEAASLANEAIAKFTSVQVRAAALNGMVIGDETGVIYVEGTLDDIKTGDMVALTGEVKGPETKSGSTPNVIVLDPESVSVLSEGSIDVSGAKNITSTIDSYEGTYLELVSVKGSIIGLANDDLLAGAAIRVPGATKRMMVNVAAASSKMSAVNYHFVTVAGYFFGNQGANPSFIPAKVIEDGGVDEAIIPVPKEENTVLFQDDFEWMDPFVQAAKAAGTAIDDSVGDNNASGGAPNLYTTASLANLAAEMVKRGYVDINAKITSIYPQANYWKFGKTSAHTGLQLPAIDYYGDLEIDFDWSPQMTSSGNIDKITLVVMVVTGGSEVVAGTYSYEAWEKGHLAWHPAKARIQITPESLIQIRPLHLEDYEGITQMRFYLDNIVVKVPGPDVDPVYANIQVDEDVLTFEGAGGEKTLTITSDQDFVINTADKWITLENNRGEKNTETEVKVTVAASELSTLREGKLTIISADSEKVIRVIQSAAGQDLDPFIAVGQNSVDVKAFKSTLDVKVQATEEYTVTPLVDWITVEPAPATKGMVLQETVKLNIAENTDVASGRTGQVKFEIASKGVMSILTVNQEKAEPLDTDVIFKDDFSWVAPAISGYDKVCADFVNGTYETLKARIDYGNSNSVAIAGDNTNKALVTAAGYTDLMLSNSAMYGQGTTANPYLKFSKSGKQSGLSFKPFDKSYPVATISVDWAVHMTNTAVDASHLQFVIEGDGTFENGTKSSDAFTYSISAPADPVWDKATAVIMGANENTVIKISTKEAFDGNFAASGQHRFYLDNIVIKKPIWSDDFSWLGPILTEYNAKAPKACSDFVNGTYADLAARLDDGNSNAFAPYNNFTVDEVTAMLAAQGYTDLMVANKAVYGQGTPADPYLKFCKNNNQSGLSFQPFKKDTEKATISLDWAIHMTSSKVDASSLQIKIEGDGTFENGTKTSAALTHSVTAPGTPHWDHASFVINGASANTVIKISVKEGFDGNFKASGQHRYYIDNLVIL